MPEPQILLREYAALNRKRKGEGVTPLEFQRWLDLAQRLEQEFPTGRPPGSRGETRMQVEFSSRASLRDGVMFNVRPIGIFVNTPFAPERGTQLEIRVRVVETGESFRSRVEVVSNNVGPNYSTRSLGMGLRFRERECELRHVLEELCGASGRHPQTARDRSRADLP